MAVPGYKSVAQQDDARFLRDVESQEPHEWHGSLWNFCGLGLRTNTLGASTAIVTHYFPCVTFGISMKRFGRGAVRNALLVFTLMLLSWAHYATQAAFVGNDCVAPAPPQLHVVVTTVIYRNGTQTHPVAHGSVSRMRHRCGKMFGLPLKPTLDSERCEQLTNAGMVLNIATAIWFLMLVVYGAARRTEMREQFKIKGSRMGDFCSWFWCMHCAMCQESRTLEVNNVEDGVWHGRSDLPLVVSAADMIEAPAVPVMTAGQPLSQAERERAAAKL